MHFSIRILPFIRSEMNLLREELGIYLNIPNLLSLPSLGWGSCPDQTGKEVSLSAWNLWD